MCTKDGKIGIALIENKKIASILFEVEESKPSFLDDIITVHAEILEQENRALVEKRKTFVHEELMEFAEQSKMSKKPAFTKIFRGESKAKLQKLSSETKTRSNSASSVMKKSHKLETVKGVDLNLKTV